MIQRGIDAMRGVIGFGIARGEIKNPKLQEFPQLVIAPALVALIWQGHVRKVRAARRARDAANPHRSSSRAGEAVMTRAILGQSLASAAGACLLLTACGQAKDVGYQGWVEADLIFVSPDEAGRVVKLNFREGDQVTTGKPLYALDDDLQQADLNQNNASLLNAKQTFDRAAALMKTGSGTQANYDTAEMSLRVAEARVNTSQTRLARRTAFAPVTGSIQQIYFREGEMVPAQRPVLSIMPPGNMKIRFFVAESELPKLALGDSVRIGCDGCAPDLTAKIYFIATTAEYTPPVIYSQDERQCAVGRDRANREEPARTHSSTSDDIRAG